MTIQNLNFRAEVRPIYDASGSMIPREIGRGVYRDDDDSLMSVCGPNFVPIQHQDIIDPILHDLEKGGYDIEIGEGNRASLYDMKGFKKAMVNTELTDNGAVMRTNVLLGDFIEVTHPEGRYGLKTGDDTMLFKMSFLNSNNSKYAARVNTSYERIECLNGMTSKQFSAGFYGKHTMNFSMDAMQAQLGNAFEMMATDAETFGLWATTPCTPTQAEELLQRTLAKLTNKANGEANFSAQLVAKVLERFRSEDKTVWGLYNAVTAWQTHEGFKSNSNKVTALIGREQKVASMLNSNPWGAFVKEAA